MSNQQIILDFFETICRNDKAAILAGFSEDGIFENIPLGKAQGDTEIWKAFAPVHDICTEIEWIVHNISEDRYGKVYTERTDRYHVNGKWAEFRVMGIFELENGKIKHWRDYFDLQQSLAALS